MSRLDAFLAGFEFRTATPTYSPGDELTAIVTGRDGDDAVIRIGDTVLRLPGAADDVTVDEEARVRVTSFDEGSATGEAELR
ncbi:DUF7513 family protein [Halolamina salina]|uniref:DUF7513 domain-containing protein n=1 Tax=Halolamina salina TaxID=1220023 RepID=A0ABD6B4A3_9EURY